jgi:acyl-coenzyme A thioesterase PaaI-like protein
MAGAEGHLRLVAETRELVDRLVRCFPREDAGEVAELLRRINARYDMSAVDDVPWYIRTPPAERSIWLMGASEAVGGAMYARFNPVAVPLEFVRDEDELIGSVVVGRAFTGPPGRVHGGVVATILDHVMGAWLFGHDQPSFTVSMTVDYLEATPLNNEIVVRGGRERSEGRKTFMWASIEHEGDVTARAKAIFVLKSRD